MANVFHQLIVLGNGFDLNCGLASRFLDFFVLRMKLIESAAPLRGATLADYLSEHELTVWDLVLFQRKKALGPRGLNNWCDVESAIADFMLDEVYPVDEMGHDYKSVIFDDVCSYWSEVVCGEGGDALVRREPSSFPPSPHSGYVDDDTKFIGIYLASRYPGARGRERTSRLFCSRNCMCWSSALRNTWAEHWLSNLHIPRTQEIIFINSSTLVSARLGPLRIGQLCSISTIQAQVIRCLRFAIASISEVFMATWAVR